MSNNPIVSKTISVSGNTPAALSWVLREEIEISKARLPDLTLADASREVADIEALAKLLTEIGGEKSELEAIRAEVSKMNGFIGARRTARYDEIHAKAWSDYEALQGKVVLLSEVECLDSQNSSVTAVCDPPVIARIAPYASTGHARQCIERWSDSTHCDPVYDVSILEPHPAFAGLRPSWIFGTSYAFDPAVSVETAKIVLADEVTQAAYAQAKGLSDDEVAPASAPAP